MHVTVGQIFVRVLIIIMIVFFFKFVLHQNGLNLSNELLYRLNVYFYLLCMLHQLKERGIEQNIVLLINYSSSLRISIT